MCGSGPITYFITIPLIVNGVGAVPGAGVLPGDLRMPFAFKITEWTIQGNDPAGSAEFDIWVKAYADNAPPTIANTICGGAYPALVAGQSAHNAILPAWTVNFTSDMAIRWNLRSAAVLTFCTLSLTARRTIG